MPPPGAGDAEDAAEETRVLGVGVSLGCFSIEHPVPGESQGQEQKAP